MQLPENAKKVFSGVLADAYQWPQKMYDGSVRTFECYMRENSVAVIPFLDRETVIMTHQEQPHIAEPFWDVPGGRVDKDETMRQAAKREFMEETGYRAEKIEEWSMTHHSGLARFDEAIYIAKNLRLNPAGNHEDDGERITVVEMKWPDLIALCLKQKIRRRDAALSILAMHYDKETKQRLETFFEKR